MPDRNSQQIRELLEAGLSWIGKDENLFDSAEQAAYERDVEQARYILHGWKEREEAEEKLGLVPKG